MEKLSDSSPERISKLPEPILQHILCFLDQKTAVQTSVLSKPWRHLWSTRPKIDFTEGDTVAGDKDAFLSVVDRTLQIYRAQNLPLKVFSLILSSADDATASLLNKWIPELVRNMGVDTFDLTLYSNHSGTFELPSPLFESESIQNLSLRGCVMKWAPPVPVYFKHLRKLRLHNVHVSEEILNKVLSNCPFIEDVSISDCTGFPRMKLLNNAKQPSTMKHFYVCNNLVGYYICVEFGSDVQSLRTVQIRDCFLAVDNKQLEFSKLTRLFLTRVILVGSDLFSSGFPCLEELMIVYCYGSKEFNLSCPSLKHFDITNINKPFVATIDAPSLVNFCYEGILPQSISFSSATVSDHDWKSDIILTSFWKYSHTESSLILNDLVGLLKASSRSEMTLALDKDMIQWLQNQLGNEDDDSTDIVGVSEAKLPVVLDHLRVEGSGRNLHSSSADFLNSVFRIFRPRYIYVDMFAKSKNELHPVAEILLKEREMAQCDFWQHVLEGVSIQVLHTNETEWKPIQYSSLSEFRNGEDFVSLKEDEEAELRVQLKWRE